MRRRNRKNIGDFDMGMSDCEIIKEDAGELFGSIGECIETVSSKHTSKIDVAESVFGIGKSLLKLGFDGTVCAVKNTPKAIATVAAVKREVTDTLTLEYEKHQKREQKKALEEKIRMIKMKKEN